MGRFYITTPIYYVNDAPHAGHAYCTVNADALARWHRLFGDETLFLTGTDEHGQKVVEAAESHGVEPREWTDRTVQRFIDAWRILDISNDDFIRTTEERHRISVQSFLSRIYENGFIYKDLYAGPYCVACEDYYTAEQLVDGKCPIHDRPVIEMEEENWFFRLSAFEQRLIDFFESHDSFTLPETKRNEALSFIKSGLRDISITRTSISWGVPVPWDERHVFYVWYDALVNYLTAIGYGRDEEMVNRWWPVSNHLIGKEIIRFHCVWWPAMCMAAGIDPPHHVQVSGWLLVGGKKLSKSMASGGPVQLTDITPQSLVDEFGTDPVRYYLLRDTALGNDGEFSLEGLTARYNTDLANSLGNLVARVATVVSSKCGGIGPSSGASGPLDDETRAVVESAEEAWLHFAPHAALESAWRLIRAANQLLEERAPWKMEPGPEVDAVMGAALEAIRVVSVLIAPALPATAREIRRRIGVEPELAPGSWASLTSDRYRGSLPVERGEALFPRIKVDA